MKKLDRFILTSFVGPFVLILLVVIFILVMQTLWVYIDELVGKGLDFRIIARQRDAADQQHKTLEEFGFQGSVLDLVHQGLRIENILSHSSQIYPFLL